MRKSVLVCLSILTAVTLVRGSQARDVSVPELLERVATYLDTFEKDYAHLIAEERYQQVLIQKRARMVSEKTTVDILSDILAAPDTGSRWLTFRDVFSVNGRKVRDRDTRLQKLFEKAGSNRFEEARRIAAEGARFNLGTLKSNINVPSMPLTFITRENRARSSFRMGDHAVLDGVPCVIIEFQETARPTLVKGDYINLPAQGSFWIEPDTGRVLQAMVRFEPRDFKSKMTVTFGPNEKLKMWVPVDMVDSSDNDKEIVNGHAVYTNYRRFDTSSVIK